MVKLENSGIRKLSQKRIKERDQQFAILNGERPSLDTKEKIYQKLLSLHKFNGLYYQIYLGMVKIGGELVHKG